MENYNKPPKFSKEQIDWIKHSINNPNSLIKQAAELSSELIGDEDEESLDDVEKNLEIIEKQSNNIKDRVNLASKEVVNENEDEININTPHGKKFLEKELTKEIEMRYPLTSQEIIELADSYGTDVESIMWVINKYETKKEKEKEEDLTRFVKDTLHNMNLSVEKPSPSFDDFYEKYEEIYWGEDEDFTKEDLKKKFLELTTDKKQLKLFEIRSFVRKIIFEQLDSDSLIKTIQKAHYALKRFDMMAPKEIITPGMVQGWSNIHQELVKELENATKENLEILQKLEFIFNELRIERGGIRSLDRQAIPEYIEDAKKFLENKKNKTI